MHGGFFVVLAYLVCLDVLGSVGVQGGMIMYDITDLLCVGVGVFLTCMLIQFVLNALDRGDMM